ncbi:MAG TPA: hypothetical protein DEA96_11375 [Leptospiraceae bacterium]|nr:hypothetical protein [Leptospiraceae bacterium]
MAHSSFTQSARSMIRSGGFTLMMQKQTYATLNAKAPSISVIPKLLAFSVILMSGLTGTSCQWIFGEPTMDPCDPAHNYYEGDRHYISRDYVREDGTLDQQKMLEALKPGHGNCANAEDILEKARQPGHSHSNTVPAQGDHEIKFPDADLK